MLLRAYSWGRWDAHIISPRFILVILGASLFKILEIKGETGDVPLASNSPVILEEPLSGGLISSPLKIKGKARGNWFFEATFPVVLTDWNRKIIAENFATVKGDPDDTAGVNWMTTDFVPFEAELKFEKPAYGKNGFLILKKDNPSGLPEHDDALEIEVSF